MSVLAFVMLILLFLTVPRPFDESMRRSRQPETASVRRKFDDKGDY